ncbi:MAG TPA: hypothetical protein VD886_24295, partial [Herpetosiphonaceae bacterium]|nr:hypothetical protein [Herpetosiphonaceae bacterium]
DLLTYTLMISNSGQTAATFLLTDTLNVNLTFVSASPAMARDGQQLTVSALLGGGGSTSYMITVRVNDNFAGTINNSATLSGDGQVRTLTAPTVSVAPSPLKKIYMPFIIR